MRINSGCSLLEVVISPLNDAADFTQALQKFCWRSQRLYGDSPLFFHDRNSSIPSAGIDISPASKTTFNSPSLEVVKSSSIRTERSPMTEKCLVQKSFPSTDNASNPTLTYAPNARCNPFAPSVLYISSNVKSFSITSSGGRTINEPPMSLENREISATEIRFSVSSSTSASNDGVGLT